MTGLPAMLNIKGRRCVVVGGGSVALRRARSLLEAGGEVAVIAPRVEPELAGLSLEIHQRGYEPGDLDGAWLVVTASSDPEVNKAVAQEARSAGVLLNRADAPEAGDFTVPAASHHGPITLAVDTGGASAAAAAVIRDELSRALDPEWPRLIELASPWRAILQSRFPDPSQRLPRLKLLCGPRARSILKQQGESSLKAYYQALTEEGEVE